MASKIGVVFTVSLHYIFSDDDDDGDDDGDELTWACNTFSYATPESTVGLFAFSLVSRIWRISLSLSRIVNTIANPSTGYDEEENEA